MAKTKSVTEALMKRNPQVTEEYYVPSLDASFTLKAVDSPTFKKIQEQATYPLGKGKQVVNEDEMQLLMIAKGCVEPNFADPKLLEHYGAKDEADCVSKALLIGEIALVSKKILEISGFTTDLTSAKN